MLHSEDFENLPCLSEFKWRLKCSRIQIKDCVSCSLPLASCKFWLYAAGIKVHDSQSVILGLIAYIVILLGTMMDKVISKGYLSSAPPTSGKVISN